MPEHEQQDAATRTAGSEDRDTVREWTEDLEWCRRAGLTNADLRRLLFVRWLYREGQITDYPEGR
ncbi:MAG TPA: hypothetical protein VFW96_09520 [Thermomicrobiales bacterium]|nr:hypothetical protein [Thermomicrobiales bacterium]